MGALLKYCREEFLNARGLGLVVAIAVVVTTTAIPGTEQISKQGVMSLGLLTAAIILWCCGTFPMSITGLLTLVLAVLLGVVEVSAAFTGFASTTFIYVIGIFALPAIMMKANWGLRLVDSLFRLTGPSSSKLVLAFMISTGIISVIMTDTPAIVVMLGPVYVVLKAIDASPGSSRLGKALMIGVPMASIIGGVSTPAGSTSNVAAMGMLEQITGTDYTFLDWTIVGLPFAVVLLPICWFFLVKILEPEPITEKITTALKREVEEAGKPTVFEYKVLVMLLLIPVLWVLGNWVPVLSIANVAIVGLGVMMLPGMRLLTFDEFQKSVPWNVVLMVGAVLSIGGMMVETGGAAFFADLFLGTGIMSLDFFWVLLISSFFLYFFHTFCPIGPAAIGIFLPVFIRFCNVFGVSPLVPTVVLGFIVAGNFLLPINPLLTITYNEGYFTFFDMFKTGIIPTIIAITVLSLWAPFITGLVGL